MMRTELNDAELHALLMPPHEFRWAAFGLPLEPERTLVLRGLLTPVTVGRTRYYLRREVDALTGGAR